MRNILGTPLIGLLLSAACRDRFRDLIWIDEGGAGRLLGYPPF
jgi:hypothetical protein